VNGYEAKTGIAATMVIQEIERVIHDDRQFVMRRVIDTGDSEIRKKLIELGWVPPEERTWVFESLDYGHSIEITEPSGVKYRLLIGDLGKTNGLKVFNRMADALSGKL
jgi:hypothetical protein